MIQEVYKQRDELLALIQKTVWLATFVIPKKRKRETTDVIVSVILKSNNNNKKTTSSYLTYYLDKWYHKAGCTHLATVNSAFDIMYVFTQTMQNLGAMKEC